jgi:hypothetical protein
VARDAIARQFDVDKNRVQQQKTTITFFAKKGRSIDVEKIFANLEATRMSDDTGNSLQSLDITVVGAVVANDKGLQLKVTGLRNPIPLGGDAAVLGKLRAAARETPALKVVGRVQGWNGHFPKFLNKPMPRPLTLLVTGFEAVKE